jgi:hypothetical protein
MVLTVKKKHDSGNYGVAEKYVMSSFERFFTFEFYIRYLNKYHVKDLRRIHLLRNIIRNKFIKLNTVKKLSRCRFSFPENPEDKYSLGIELDDLVDWTLDALQRSHISTDNLCFFIEYGGIPFSDRFKEHLFIPYKLLEKYVKPRQRNLAYRFSQLTSQNNINFVFNWWCEHINCKPNDKKDTVLNLGVFKHVRELNEDGSYSVSGCFESVPFLSPSVRFYPKDDNYFIFISNIDSIIINGQELSNSVVLCARFDKKFPDFDKAFSSFENNLSVEHYGWLSEQLQSGVRLNLYLNDSKSSVKQTFESSDQYACILERSDSILKNLIGLMCFDEVHNKENYKSKTQAANDVSDKIQKYMLRDASLIEGIFDDISNKIDQIHEVIKFKRNRQKYNEKYKFKKK